MRAWDSISTRIPGDMVLARNSVLSSSFKVSRTIKTTLAEKSSLRRGKFIGQHNILTTTLYGLSKEGSYEASASVASGRM